MQKQNNRVCVDGVRNTNSESTVSVTDADSADIKCHVKAYETPILIAYGDVRDITLGGTLGAGESGAGFETFDVFRP